MSKFSYNTDVDKLIKTTIAKHHKHLAGNAVKAVVKMAAVGKTMGEQDEGKKPKICKVHRLNERLQFLTGHQFMVEIDENYWNFLAPEIKDAEIDKALCQMGINEKGSYLVDPDVTVYTAIIERHGFYTDELEGMRTRLAQLPLVFEAPKEETVQ